MPTIEELNAQISDAEALQPAAWDRLRRFAVKHGGATLAAEFDGLNRELVVLRKLRAELIENGKLNEPEPEQPNA